MARKQDLLAVTTTYVDTLQGEETTLWSANPDQAQNPNTLQLARLPGYACDFRRRTEGIEFELHSANPEDTKCVLITNDNVIHTAGCGTNKIKVCVI